VSGGAFSRNKGARADYGRPLSHGHCVRYRDSPTYKSWMMMRTRCNNPNYDGYADYGGRGITVCERWGQFEAFLADMGERPSGTSIDRIDVNGNYEPNNCRWATTSEQNRNMRHGRRVLFGVLQTFRDALEKHGGDGVSLSAARRRRDRLGWSEEDAIKTPIRATGRPPNEELYGGNK
jgi:hypothetical protein